MDYREHYDTRPGIHTYHDRDANSYAGPLIALGVIVALIAGVFFLGGTGDVATDAGQAAPAASGTAPAMPAEPAAQ